MTPVILILSLIWLIRIFGNIVSFAHLWRIKEYRWDRMVIHLRTLQGKRVYFLPWKLPMISPKSIFLVGSSCVILSAFIFFSRFPVLLSFLLADIGSFPLTFLLVGIINVPAKLYHMYLIGRSQRLLRSHHNMTVIGITGSYGKTSTKDYLATIVSTQYTTLKTEASKNSPIGIAEVVVSKLRPDHRIFIVEMGAYKMGEIACMSGLVRPEIAIVTAINAQHQDLFGSLENTMKAKYELVSGLSGKRIAILNADDPRVRSMGEWAQRDGLDVWWFSTKKETLFHAANILASIKGVDFNCVFGKEIEHIHAPVIGKHQVGNILAAIAAAVAAGMQFSAACTAASAVLPAHGVLEQVDGVHGITLIDDTFNNNPDAAKAALDVLSMRKGKRILVFQPMIELGKYATSSHKEVGAYAARMCDAIILTNANWSQDFIDGVRSVSETVPVSVLPTPRAAAYIQEMMPKTGTVLFKGKEAKHVLALLKKT